MSPRQQALSLYKSLLREAAKFSAYNFRQYAIRRVKDEFRFNKQLQDEAEVSRLLVRGRMDLELIKRQVLVGDLYRTDKLVIENVRS